MLIALLLLPLVAAQAETPIDFQRQVRPVLSDNCFHCHGPDQNTRKGKFRLDVREDAVARPARGLYQLPDAQVEAAHTLAEAAALVPKGIVCLTSALQYHELTLQMPAAVWMAKRASRYASGVGRLTAETPARKR